MLLLGKGMFVPKGSRVIDGNLLGSASVSLTTIATRGLSLRGE